MPRSEPTEPDRPHLALQCYSLVQAVAMTALLPVMALYPRLRGGLGQRLGRWSFMSRERPIWLHGSSAGDMLALAPLARGMIVRGYPVVMSTWTRAGHQMARRLTGGEVPVYRAPLDLALMVRAVLRKVRPRLLVLECLEMWPRLVSTCHQIGVPVAVVNGRLSVRSLALYRHARWIFEPCFSSLAMVTALTSEFAERFIEAGVRPARVFVETSSKHAIYTKQHRCPDRHSLTKVVLGSLHGREEDMLLPWIGRLRGEIPGLMVVIAPRYPHRARRVQKKLRRLGIDSSLSSGAGPEKAPVLVVDEMGHLAEQYRGARLAFVGGSLVPVGGHNIIEPVAQGCPVLYGGYIDHCSEEARMLERVGAGTRVVDGSSFYECARRLLSDSDHFERSSVAGLEVANTLATAADRLLQRLLMLPTSVSG